MPGGCLYEKDDADVDFNSNVGSTTYHGDRSLICKQGKSAIVPSPLSNSLLQSASPRHHHHGVGECVQTKQRLKVKTADCQYSIYSCLESAGMANTAPRPCLFTLTQSHTHTLTHTPHHLYLLL